MTYSIWPFGPSSMSVAPLFPENPVKMVVPTGVNCKNRERQMHIKTQNIKETIEGLLSRAFYFIFPLLLSIKQGQHSLLLFTQPGNSWVSKYLDTTHSETTLTDWSHTVKQKFQFLFHRLSTSGQHSMCILKKMKNINEKIDNINNINIDNITYKYR